MDLLDGLDGLLITNPVNIRYITGFIGLAPEELEGFVLIRPGKLNLFVHTLYIEKAKEVTSGKLYRQLPITVIETTRDYPTHQAISEALGPQNGESRIKLGVEETNLTLSEYQQLNKNMPQAQIFLTRGRIEFSRRSKTESELQELRAASNLTDAAYKHVIRLIKTEMSEVEIAWEIEMFIRKNGGLLSFAPIVAFNEHSSRPHHESDGTKLESQSIILMDFGAKVNGYYGDMTRMVFMGEPKSEWRRAYETCLAAQMAAIKYLTETTEVHGLEADKIAREIVEKAGYPTFPHGLGHGVGLNIHEDPRLTRSYDVILQPGNVFSIEPGIYLPGEFGVRIEDLAVKTNDGIELLNTITKELTVI